jgi:hypothetical protein
MGLRQSQPYRVGYYALEKIEQPTTTALHSTRKRSFSKHAANASNEDLLIHSHLKERVREKRQDVVFFPLQVEEKFGGRRAVRKTNKGDVVVVQIDYGDNKFRYYLLYLHTDKWDYLAKRDAEMCGTLPTELQYYDVPSSCQVRRVENLTIMKGGQVTENGLVLMTYTARVRARTQLLVHVEVRDPYKRNGGKHYFLPSGTSVRRLKEVHGHERAVWKSHFTKDLLSNSTTLDDLAKAPGKHACVVVINENVSVSSEETEDDESADGDCYHPRPKRQRLARYILLQSLERQSSMN